MKGLETARDPLAVKRWRRQRWFEKHEDSLRAKGLNPRKLGLNPRAKGTNPRAVKTDG